MLDRIAEAAHNRAMGLLLKLALLGVALYAAWKTLSRWKGLYDRFVGPPPKPPVPERPTAPPPPPPPPQTAAARPPVIEETVPCRVCGAYLSRGAIKCGRPDCPLP